jgi:transcriptional regulator with XRE-family HTH domain
MAKFSIGSEIKKIVKKRGFTVEELATALNVSKPNIFDIYKRETIDTGLLERICKVLNHNFFQYYADKYQTDYDRLVIQRYKDKNDFLVELLKEKEEVYQLLLTQIKK